MQTAAKGAPRVRLAATTDPGAELYNAYHVITQVAALHAAASSTDPHPEAEAVWTALADQALEDLGELYQVWEHAAKLQTPPAAASLHAAIRRAVDRASVVTSAVNVWLPAVRLARLARLVEGAWGRIARRLAADAPAPLATRLAKLEQRSVARADRLKGLLQAHLNEAARRDASYAAAAPLLKGGLSA